MRKMVLIIGGGIAYERMFIERDWIIVDSMKDADLVVFTGGADVQPHLYSHEKFDTTMVSVHRDATDAQYYELAKRMGKPMAGICRGGQFLNVCNGGTMIQDCDGHANGRNHIAYDTKSEREVVVSSTHHQMMVPNMDTAEVLMVADEATTRIWYDTEVGDFVNKHMPDVEVVLYKDAKCLCFQPHPEFNNVEECRDVFFEYVDLILDD